MQIETITSGAARFALLNPTRNNRPPGYRSRSFLHVFAMGMRAAAEFRRFDAMSDAQLARLGLTRAHIPRLLFERHFAE